jgi:hypothetical protein
MLIENRKCILCKLQRSDIGDLKIIALRGTFFFPLIKEEKIR